LRKKYGGTDALSSVDVDVYPGEIHALLGENGAGKSTLVRILTGVERADGGTINFYGQEVASTLTVESATHLGVGVIHQQHSLVPSLSIADNVALVAGYPGGRRIDWARTRAAAASALDALGVSLDPRALVAGLPTSMQSIVAIARALALHPPILLLDEPTASLESREVGVVFDVLARLRSRGVAIVLITHRLDEVTAHADRVTVLRDGRVTHTGQVADTSIPELVNHIVGAESSGLTERSLVQDQPGSHPQPGLAPLLTVEALDGEGLRDVNLRLDRGEILGCTGLLGAGHNQLGKALIGLLRPPRGAMTLGNQHYAPRSPVMAVAAGVGYLPPDRVNDGLFFGMSVAENLFPSPAGRWWRRRRNGAEGRAARELLDRFDIRPRDSVREVSTLSGGNAQKVLLARVLSQAPVLLVLEEPTVGVDVGSRAAIHALIRDARTKGTGVVLVSSDMEEITELADRVAVFGHGTVVATIERADIDMTAILMSANAAPAMRAAAQRPRHVDSGEVAET
jgi:ribose transport system ATP-binding protein